ncbi:Fe(3+)-hydroxamate ABC transporter permease FhuB [Cypionkella sp.]|uniref:Fe(3+)-hydroxamate ABC transporter permease FhuB n=1 Tax=Cypionkella sp. TaxID=2811411 RepID=UPI002ABA3FE6|nr:Fe(3+)-hydroxamate ABC transporter permease FhuB [Cypionkella sp.]MDZ4394189.1 Fe(3+)-hydroxamate ABC transporter permease FhuB [Cypionkella sp.]
MSAAAKTTAVALAVLTLCALHLTLAVDLRFARMAQLIAGAAPQDFADALFVQGALPRLVMAALVGAALGLAGSLMQQLTQNALVSPMTMGVSSGAWLALVLAAIVLPGAVRSEWVALAGAAVAAALVLAVTGARGLVGMQAPLAGMAVNLLFGSMAATAMLLANPYTEHLFLWGAGDLTQTSWEPALWLLPRLLPGVVIAALLIRPLSLLRLGAQAAGGRGMVLWPVALAAALAALHLAAVSVTAVGMIGFIGLVAPNMARLLGARRAGAELWISAGLGAACLIAADVLALALQALLPNIVPTGATAAFTGAVALIWLLRRKLGAQDHAVHALPAGAARVGVMRAILLALACAALGLAALFVGVTQSGWELSFDPMLLSLRWPRVMAAASAGASMALAGCILQRLIRNPLASPDILGMSAGAVAALVGVALITGGSIHAARLPVALAGCAAALALLLWFGRRHSHAPAALALIGIALGAGLDALVRLSMAGGTAETFAILGWMSGSTYRIDAARALGLTGCALIGLVLAALALRPLTLLGAGDGIAIGRGLALAPARRLLMLLAAGVTAGVTAFMGPVSFVGLVGPHLAVLLGARRMQDQLIVAPLAGAALMVLSDWLGRIVLYPTQLPAGSVAAILGGSYFLLLLARRRGQV